ncbi:hypothetical protein ACFX2J_027438 [Malus domestica]
MGFEIEADVAEDKGMRHAIKDVWVVLLDDAGEDFPRNLRREHFAVYDGHEGRLAVERSSCMYHSRISQVGTNQELHK